MLYIVCDLASGEFSWVFHVTQLSHGFCLVMDLLRFVCLGFLLVCYTGLSK